MFIRGIGQADFINTAEPGVGVYIDGIYHPRAIGSLLELTDVNRVEIIRGPQGATFGRNSIGGSINVITEPPDMSAFTATTRLRLGEDGYRELALGLNTPISERIAGRFSAMKRQRDGYLKALSYDGLLLGGDDLLSFRGQLGFNLTEQLSIRLIAEHASERESPAPLLPRTIGDYYNADSGPVAGDGAVFNDTLASNAACAISEVLRQTDSSCYGEVWNVGRTGSHSLWVDADNNVVVPVNKSDLDAVSIIIDWRPGLADLTYLGSHRQTESRFWNDLDFSPHPVFHNNNNLYNTDSTSHEFRSNKSLANDRVNLLLGLYYFRESGTETVDVIRARSVQGSEPGMLFQINDRAVLNHSYAIYGQISWSFATNLELSVGNRRTVDKKEIALTLYRATTTIGPNFGDLRISESSPSISLRWSPSSYVTAYLRAAEGFRSGGFPTRFPGGIPASIPYYDPEYVQTHELGARIRSNSGRLSTNVAIFASEYDDMQISAAVPLPGYEAITATDNLGNAHISGVEVDFIANLTSYTMLSLSAAHLRNRISSVVGGQLDSAGLPIDRNNVLPFTPDLSTSLQVSQLFPVDGGALVELRAGWTIVSDQYFRIENCVDCYEPSYDVMNVSAMYSPAHERWRASLRGRNVLNESYSTMASFGVSNIVTFSNVARPREWSLEFEYFFGR
jgi:iron complex outermembrane receptor protein